MRSSTGDKQRLLHIKDAIEEIGNYTKGSDEEIFLRDSMMKYACVKQIEIIGEVARVLSDEFKNKYTEVKWFSIAGIRNLLIHEYWGIDFNVLWKVINEDIPVLKEQIESILKN